jgi:ribosomal protein S18 acetylase RimI-like enzyme
MTNIRPFDTKRDLTPCLAIWRRAAERVHPLAGADPLDLDESLVRELYLPAAEVHVAERDGKPLGFVALLGRLLGGPFVDPDCQGDGIGRALVAHAIKLRPCLDVEIFADDTRARDFFEACGFSEIGRRGTDDQGRPIPMLILRHTS